MTTDVVTEKKPLWISIEEKILQTASEDLSNKNLESAIHKIADELDNQGFNVSCHGGNLLNLRSAINARLDAGKPFLKDFNEAIAALKLEDLADPHLAAMKLITEVGQAWPDLHRSERRADVLRIMEKTRFDLLIAKAKSLAEDEGVRYLIAEEIDSKLITEALGVSQEKFSQVNAQVESERAERDRVKGLLEASQDKSDEEKVKYLINSNVSEELMIEMAGVDKAVIDSAKQAMEEELKEKKRKEEEEAEKKAAEAAGPPLEEIPPEELLGYIEEIRDILEFSDVEKEIRGMCEQSNIPKCLADIAVSDPEKLDELEKKAEE
ncbi:hypothetical protein ACFL5V_03995 [Fibrobacterota bacterium]